MSEKRERHSEFVRARRRSRVVPAAPGGQSSAAPGERSSLPQPPGFGADPVDEPPKKLSPEACGSLARRIVATESVPLAAWAGVSKDPTKSLQPAERKDLTESWSEWLKYHGTEAGGALVSHLTLLGVHAAIILVRLPKIRRLLESIEIEPDPEQPDTAAT